MLHWPICMQHATICSRCCWSADAVYACRVLNGNGFDQVLVMDRLPVADTLISNTAQADVRMLLATKAALAVAGESTSDKLTGDNVAEWFTKPGLAGLAEQASGTAVTQADGDVQLLSSPDRLMEQWRMSS
eukprot:GHRR01016934.1.p1 GENE.GHRR01016934.1~~GHRR01016934.1.p1  ORF type:complete len:131 (-),score=44.84 GHRR01016934.1:500-892(-)